MQKNRLTDVRDYIVRHSKFVFPIIVIAAVAVTVSIALNAGNAKAEPAGPDASAPEASGSPDPGKEAVASLSMDEDVPLVVNEDEKIQAIVIAYYNAKVHGDGDTLKSLYDEISEWDMLDYMETAKYLEYIPALEIYTKPGLGEGETIVYVYYRLCFVNHEDAEVPGWQTFYVCTDENGELYFKNGGNITEEEAEYITRVSGQDDVIEVNNRVAVEFNELVENHPEMKNYMTEMKAQINMVLGVALAERKADARQPEGGEPSGEEQSGGTEPTPEPQPPAESGPRYATTTATVNVRSSDSMLAEKLGKATGGMRLEVQEVRLNGWTKVVFEGKDGYIKSEYLNMEETVAGLEVIGTVTATTNINVRTAASQESASMGILAGGSSLDLFANEGDWCKVNFQGRVGYVKSEFVTQ